MRYKLPLFISIILGIIGVVVPFLIHGRFEEAISAFGAIPETAVIFNFLMATSGVFLLLFAIAFAKDHYKLIGKLPASLMIVSAAGLYILGIFPIGLESFIRTMHWIGAAMLFGGYCLLMLSMGYKFRNKHRKFSDFSITFGTIASFCLTYFILFKGYRFVPQIISIIIVLAWNYLLFYVFDELVDR